MYSYCVELSKGTFVNTYLAIITGPDEKYCFKRGFLKRKYNRNRRQLWFTFDMDHGVYEQSVKHIDKHSGNTIRHEKNWFVYFEGMFYKIRRDEVLFCVFNLELQSKLIIDNI